MRRGLVAGGLVAALSGVTGCGSPTPSGEVRFDGPSAPSLDALLVLEIPPPPEVAAPEQDVLDRIEADPAAFFGRVPPAAVLNEAELVYFAAGRTFALADHYRAAVDDGAEALRPRYAWILERLGLHAAALEQSQLAVETSPESADAWFVRGFVLGQSETADHSLLRAVRDAYARVAALDPGWVGPSGATARDLAAQVRQIDGALSAPAREP